MSTTKSQTTANAAETVKVKLSKAHTHEGKDHPEGAELEVDKATAEWLRKAGVVETTPAAATPSAQA